MATRKSSTAGGATRVSVAATAMIALRKMSLLSELDEEDLGADEARSRWLATYSHHLPGWLRVPWPLVALALTLALVAVLPIDLCFFDAQLEGTRALLWVCDAFFLVDLLLQLVNAIVVSVRARRSGAAAEWPLRAAGGAARHRTSAPYDLIAAAGGAPPPTCVPSARSGCCARCASPATRARSTARCRRSTFACRG